MRSPIYLERPVLHFVGSAHQRSQEEMRILFITAAAFAAFALSAPAAITSADAQTVVIKRGHGHGHGHMQPRRKKVIVIDHGRRHGWRHNDHRRSHGHMHHNRPGTVGISVR
jgi:hypothetical protein